MIAGNPTFSGVGFATVERAGDNPSIMGDLRGSDMIMIACRRPLSTIGLLCGLVLSGCATTPKLSHEQVLSRYQEIARLEDGLNEAKQQGVDYLAPIGYRQSQEALGKALTAAQDGRSEAANKAATGGLQSLQTANFAAQRSREILREVLEVRERASQAGATQAFADETADLEKDLRKLSQLIEQGKLDSAKERRPELISGYSRLELRALKASTVASARSAIAHAKEENADKLAPKTLKLSEEELALAQEVLNTDRSQREKAAHHAERAQWLAEKAAAIAELAKDFDRRDYSMEDIVLWYQDQLTTINSPRGGELPFNRDNREVVLDLQRAVEAAGKTKTELESQLAATETRLKEAEAKLQTQSELSKEELSRLQQEKQEQEQREREDQQRFEFVQSLFKESEADVYRQRRNVLIAAHGFHFPSGQSEITAVNFELMNKIVQAIKTFPGSKVVVSGHTDSTGDVQLNQRLSEERAEKVAMFLNEVGGISPARITFQGFGKSRPVATNETPEGRATNRRVEILIVNP